MLKAYAGKQALQEWQPSPLPYLLQLMREAVNRVYQKAQLPASRRAAGHPGGCRPTVQESWMAHSTQPPGLSAEAAGLFAVQKAAEVARPWCCWGLADNLLVIQLQLCMQFPLTYKFIILEGSLIGD